MRNTSSGNYYPFVILDFLIGLNAYIKDISQASELELLFVIRVERKIIALLKRELEYNPVFYMLCSVCVVK